MKTCAMIVAMGFSIWASALFAQQLPLVFQDNFESGMARWLPSDGRLNDTNHESVWRIIEVPRSGATSAGSVAKGNKVLRVTGKSEYEPPYRSPHSIAWLRDIDVASFQIDVRVQSTRPDAGPHRDLCIFWGKQSASQFYYVHLGAKPDPHACQIFIVNNAARKAITTNEPKGTDWTNGWHNVRVTYDSSKGDMHVYFDDMETAAMTAKDLTFTHGQVGLGTFDDHGNFDDFVLRGDTVKAQAETE